MEHIDVNENQSVNVGNKERLVSLVAGTILVNRAFNGKLKPAELIAGGYLLFRGYAGYCPVYGLFGKKNLPDPNRNINVRSTTLVSLPAMDAYAYWRDLNHIPELFRHISNMEIKSPTRSVWTAGVFENVPVWKWEAEIVKDEPGRLIGWKSVPGSVIRNAGKVEFVEVDPYTTRINVVVSYKARGGIGVNTALRAFSPLFRSVLNSDMVSFKERLEAVARKNGEYFLQ